MFLVSIAFGILAGIIAAAIALLSGSGLLTAFIIYIAAGIAGAVITAVWIVIPKQSNSAKSAVTQRS